MVSFFSSAAAVLWFPEFLACTETAVRYLPLTFAIQSLSDFEAGWPAEMLLCPVRGPISVCSEDDTLCLQASKDLCVVS